MPYGTLLTARTRCDCLINASIDGLLRLYLSPPTKNALGLVHRWNADAHIIRERSHVPESKPSTRRNDTAIPAGPEDEFGQFADLNGFRIPKIKDLIQSALIE